MIFGEYLRLWLKIREPELERSTYEAYTVYVNRHIIPALGAYELSELKPLHIQEYVTEKLERGRCDGTGGLSRVSVHKHLQVIKEAINRAVILELVDRNPAALIRTPRVRVASDDDFFLDLCSARALITAFREEEHPLYPLVLVTLYYGLRRSEVLGLTWSAVSFPASTIRISRTVVKGLTIVEKDRPKTASSCREYELLPEIRDLLLELKKRQALNRARCRERGLPCVENDYIFTWEDGRLFRPDYVTRGFQRVLRRQKLPEMTFHGLRHGTASILFDKGWSIKDVQAWLGHSDVKVTMSIYIHYRRSRLKLVGKDLAGLFLENKKAPSNDDAFPGLSDTT